MSDGSFLGNLEGCRFRLGRFRSKHCCCVCSVILFEWHSEISQRTPRRHGFHKLDYLEFLVTEVASHCKDGFCSSFRRGFSFCVWSSLGVKRYGIRWARCSFFKSKTKRSASALRLSQSSLLCLPRLWLDYSCFHFPFCYFILCNVFSTLIHVMIIHGTVLKLKNGSTPWCF